MNKDYEKIARRRVKKKKGFYYHLATYTIINAFILIMNASDGDFSIFNGPLVPWGVGLAFHYLGVFGIPGSGILTKEWEEKELEKELERLGGGGSPLNGDKNADKEELELKELRKNWNDKDLV